jgi:hypothetical protein
MLKYQGEWALISSYDGLGGFLVLCRICSSYLQVQICLKHLTLHPSAGKGIMLISVSERFEAWTVFACSNTEIVDPNPTRCLDVCMHLFCVRVERPSRPFRFTPGETALGAYWIVGWVGPVAGLDDMEKWKFLILPGLEPRPHSLPAIASWYTDCAAASLNNNNNNKKTPWSESASELYRPSYRRLSAKWLSTFADRGCHVASVTKPYGRILDFLDSSRYFSIK